jgi:multicomponent Na+:H+ antiporter subunit E
MSFFAVNLLLSFVWAALVGVELRNLVIGFVIGFLVLVVSRPFVGSGAYVTSSMAIVRLTVIFLVEFGKANLRLAADVLRRQPRFRPAFLRVDVSDLGPAEVTLLAALVSLTPGSITVDAIQEGRVLVVHTVYAHDVEAARRSIRAFADLINRVGRGARVEPGHPGDQS